ncbi:MAG TPA: CarD family transcriptional regulator [Acetobacteraceae bacterium]|nr:CarD family transcriptional regulator [Acetobacteraceae bacterium]
MKASAGTAAKGRGASAPRPAAPRRTASTKPAKAAHAAAVKKIVAAPAKVAKAASAKTETPSAAPKPATAAKVIAAKPGPAKQEAKAHAVPTNAAPLPAPLAAKPAPKPTAAPLQAVQEKAPAPALTPTAAAPAAVPVQSPGRPMMPDRPPPRPMAKAEIFVEGDHVVYPTHGVGKVERIATEEIAGHKLELIHITFEENRMTLRVPVAKARTAGLRKLATRKLFDEALSVLKGRARIKRTMWSRRAQEYEAKINSGDPLAIAEVVRDLHRNAGQPDQSFSERQIYEAAMDRLAAELAALDKTDKLTAATKLTNFLKTVS